MKRVVICIILLLPLVFILSLPCRAAASLIPDDPIDDLRLQVSDEVIGKMEKLGYTGDITSGDNIGFREILSLLLSEFTSALSGPLSACAVIVGVLILSSVLEGYTHSLRYTETRDIMAAVTSLMLVSVLIAPLVSLIRHAGEVFSNAASLMLLYVPLMAAIIGFSGRLVQAGGYCATVMTASQVIAQLSAHLFPQLLCAYLAISISCGVSGRVKLSGFSELLGRFIRWFLGIVMALYSAVLTLQSAIARAGDTVASRAARMTLSSLIPLIGSAVSDAYKTLQGSMDLLRSGAGVFVILAILVAFLPIVVQSILWLLTVRVSGYAAEALGVTAPMRLLTVIGSVLSVLIALIVSVMSVFLISSAVLIRAGASP